MRLRRSLPAALLAGGLLASGCGSSKPTAATSTAKPPINIGVITTLSGPVQAYPAMPIATKAAAAAVNNAGGVGGHPINVIVCDDQSNPNLGTQCANQMVASHAIYVTGATSVGTSILPVLKAASIPWLTGVPNSSAELTSTNSYPLDAGSFISVAATGSICAKLGAKKIAIAQLDVAAAATLVPSIYKAIGSFGLTKDDTTIVKIPATAVDLSSYAAALTSQSKCVAVVLPSGLQVALAAAVHSADPTFPVAVAGVATPTQWKTIGSKSDNVYEDLFIPPYTFTQSPGIAQYNKEMDAYPNGKSSDKAPESIAAWEGVHLVAKYLAGVPNPTGASLIQALDSAGPINLAPLPPLNYAQPTGFVTGLRLFSNDLIFVRFQNGTAVPYFKGQYVDFQSLKTAPPLN